jgi:hypothetical protein
MVWRPVRSTKMETHDHLAIGTEARWECAARYLDHRRRGSRKELERGEGRYCRRNSMRAVSSPSPGMFAIGTTLGVMVRHPSAQVRLQADA